MAAPFKRRRVQTFICAAAVTLIVLITTQKAWLDADYLPMKPSGILNSTDWSRSSANPLRDKDYVENNSLNMTGRAKKKLKTLGRTDMFNNSRQCEKRLPDCIIIGVMKAGTEAFAIFLGIHPRIAMQYGLKATMYFTSNYDKGVEWYRDTMACAAADQVTMEKSPQYWGSHVAPERIHNLDPNMKLIVLVRNPIDRAVSHYLQVKHSNPDKIFNKTFEEMVFKSSGKVIHDSSFISLSTYSVIYKHWLKYFNKRQILVIDGDSFKQDQIKSLSMTEDFLGIEHYITRDRFVYSEEKGFYCLISEAAEDGMACLSNGKGRQHPELSEKQLSKLRKYFRPYNEEFYNMSGYRFDW